MCIVIERYQLASFYTGDESDAALATGALPTTLLTQRTFCAVCCMQSGDSRALEAIALIRPAVAVQKRSPQSKRGHCRLW